MSGGISPRCRVALVGMALGSLLVVSCGLRAPNEEVKAATAAAEGQGKNALGSGAVAAGVTGSGDSAGPTSAGSAAGGAGAGGAATPGGASTGAAATAAPSGGNGGATDVGVTGDTITVANVSDLGGPVPGLFSGGPYGTQAYFNYINSQGGVFGRKLKLVTADDQLQCSSNEAAYSNLVGKVFAFVGSWSLDDNCGAQIMKNHPDVPMVQQALTTDFQNLPNEYSVAPYGTGAPLGPFLYFKQKFPDDITKVGTLVGNQPAAVASWQHIKAAMQSVGYKVIYEDIFPAAQTNFTADVVRMRSAGVQMVYLQAVNGPDAAFFAQEAAQQGWHPHVWICGVCYYGAYLQQSGGATSIEAHFANTVNGMFLGEDAATVPEIGLFKQWLHSAYPSFTPDQFAANSWANAALFVEALKAAGPKLTRAAVLAALRRTHVWNDHGMVAPTDVASKKPSNCYLLLQVHGGAWNKIDDPPAPGFRCDAPYFTGG